MINEKYSYKSFKRQSFLDASRSDFDGMEIVGTSFYQDNHHTDVFPKNMSGVIFTGCNLDNCNVPAGATIRGGTNKHIAKQKDGEWWIVDKDGKPIEPRDKAKFETFGISTLPKDIPSVAVSEPITFSKDPTIIEKRELDALRYDDAKLKELSAKAKAAGVK
jgi:hypothetical protein